VTEERCEGGQMAAREEQMAAENSRMGGLLRRKKERALGRASVL